MFLAYVWLIVLIVYVVATRLYNSPWGRSLRAIRVGGQAVQVMKGEIEA